VPARVSVVVPVYNVEQYLEACLESVAQQTMSDLEVVMVDDGSTDESPGIARSFAERDGRFRLVSQGNAGLGAARNTGAAHASGEFIAFVDSDDVVPRHAYEVLLAALDETGSDFASGNVERLTTRGPMKATFLGRTFERTRLRTHITRSPGLLADRTAWNKLFRRSFWDRHGLRFPVGVYYEDTPVTLPAHYLARSVDMLEQTVYLWRKREGEDLSITQRRTETKTLRDRVAAVDHVSRFLDEQGLKVSKALYDRSVVGSDLRFFLEVLPIADEDYRRLFLDLTNDFIDRADRWVLDQPLAIDRLKWELVRRRALEELLDVLRFEDEDLRTTPPVREGRHWFGDYPFRREQEMGIPRSVYRLEDELAPVFRLEDLRWEGETLRIEGYAYVTMIGAPERGSQDVELVARPRHSLRRRLRLETGAVHRPDVTAGSAQEIASLDWAGFVATLDASRLKRRGRWQEGIWDLSAVIRSDSLSRTARRPEEAPLYPVPPAELVLPDGTRLRAALSPTRALTLEVQHRPSRVTTCVLDEGVLQLEGETLSGGSAPALRARRRAGAVALEYPAFVDRSMRPPRFVARLPVEDLLGEVDAGAGVEELSDGISWDLYLAGRRNRRRLALDEALSESAWTFQGREIRVGSSPDGGTMVTESASCRPVVTDVSWTRAGSLVLGGRFRGPASDYDLYLSLPNWTESYRRPLTYAAGTGRFEVQLAPARIDSPTGARALAEGVWHLRVGPRGGSRQQAVRVAVDRDLLGRMPVSAENDHKRFRFGVANDDWAALVVERDLTESERGGIAQRLLRTSVYPGERHRPLRQAVLYSCFGGREYSDSPRAIYEELVRRDAPFEHLWIVRDAAFTVPDTAVPIRHGSREYYEALARARYVVANDHLPRWFSRRREQRTVQTWHGAPLKRQGYELADRPKALGAYRRALTQTAGSWQILLSPAPFATPILERAFPFALEIVESGLPRRDMLLRPDRDRLGESVKRRLGLDGKRVVLYAPTYRDHLELRGGERQMPKDLPLHRADGSNRGAYRLGQLLDVAALASALGEDHAVLFRRHRLTTGAAPESALDAAIDVSGFPDPTELLLAVDVLVTDYSSAIFDFAATGRPMLFFTPDLEAYRDEIRGFSVDFAEIVPGPLLRTTDEVIESLRDPDALGPMFAKRYERFVSAYCPLDDGGAAGRVVDAVFRD
jgi:CDP-glycerol glycerophosphotransferase